jgi:hypothetical protein
MSERDQAAEATSTEPAAAAASTDDDRDRREARRKQYVLRKRAQEAAEAPAAAAPGVDGNRGRQVSAEYGDFWVVPDDQANPGADNDQVSESELASIQQLWRSLQDGSGPLRVENLDRDGSKYASFSTIVMRQIRALLSGPAGRRLLLDFLNSNQLVCIRPRASFPGGFRADGDREHWQQKNPRKPGAGGFAYVEMDEFVSNTDLRVVDADGRPIAMPLFIALGHELIHARHVVTGRRQGGPPKDAHKYASDDPRDPDNREEEATIGDGELTENDLRAEHGLPLRRGHGGSDARYPPTRK